MPCGPVDVENALQAMCRCSAHTLQVLSGSGCELWLNAELRVALLAAASQNGQPGYYLTYEEAASPSRRPDMTLYDPADVKTKTHSIEGKVVLATSRSRVRKQLTDLKGQLTDAITRGIPSGNALGVIYLVFQQWMTVAAGPHHRDVTFDGFAKRIRDEVDQIFCQPNFSVHTKPAALTLIPAQSIWIGSLHTTLALGAIVVSGA